MAGSKTKTRAKTKRITSMRSHARDTKRKKEERVLDLSDEQKHFLQGLMEWEKDSKHMHYVVNT